ncbi:MAG: Nif3-like dinuclear metal center hexameric protein [Thermodesulfobacteriota bacterium]
MKVRVNNILEGLGQIAPFGLAESWDNVGLLIGAPEREVTSLLLGLDPSLSLLQEAIDCGADTLVTHHPCIFRPLPAVNTSTPTGAFLEQALAHKINVVACHTNFDSAAEGVSDALAARLGVKNLRPLLPADTQKESNTGLGRIGNYPEPLPFQTFMQKVFTSLDLDTVQLTGPPPETVKTVALCGGSGSDLAEEAFRHHADVYLSAEIKHSTARWAEESGFCVIDGTHYATEQPAMALLGERLASLAREKEWDLNILQSKNEQPAFRFIHKTDFQQ